MIGHYDGSATEQWRLLTIAVWFFYFCASAIALGRALYEIGQMTWRPWHTHWFRIRNTVLTLAICVLVGLVILGGFK